MTFPAVPARYAGPLAMAALDYLYAPETGNKRRALKDRLSTVLLAINGAPFGFKGLLTPECPVYDHPNGPVDPIVTKARSELLMIMAPPALDEASRLADALENGAGSDIWYDADDYVRDEDDDEDPDVIAGNVIEETQTAMNDAARLLRSSVTTAEALRPLVEALNKALHDGNADSAFLHDLADKLDILAAPEAVQEFSGGDPGYKLITRDGPVILTLETPEGIERKAAFATIANAVAYLDTSTTIDPVDLKAGCYGIDAPHGLGNDSEAVPLATSLGFQIFWSMGAACWAPKGVAISGNVSGKGWRTGFDTLEAAALAALATVEP